jgi:predicted nucleotidyltransferase
MYKLDSTDFIIQHTSLFLNLSDNTALKQTSKYINNTVDISDIMQADIDKIYKLMISKKAMCLEINIDLAVDQIYNLRLYMSMSCNKLMENQIMNYIRKHQIACVNNQCSECAGYLSKHHVLNVMLEVFRDHMTGRKIFIRVTPEVSYLASAEISYLTSVMMNLHH